MGHVVRAALCTCIVFLGGCGAMVGTLIGASAGTGLGYAGGHPVIGGVVGGLVGVVAGGMVDMQSEWRKPMPITQGPDAEKFRKASDFSARIRAAELGESPCPAVRLTTKPSPGVRGSHEDALAIPDAPGRLLRGIASPSR